MGHESSGVMQGRYHYEDIINRNHPHNDIFIRAKTNQLLKKKRKRNEFGQSDIYTKLGTPFLPINLKLLFSLAMG
ncbi:Hypothetical predicted protein [Octopus vulgaris]|uniref:Uncharacterized protein n=1 Tax=Octopus vulgaris TaxID=6645 RepID=A0AA36AJA3_OCTVU|nr:Hypothetical predicted protein [Octopus vulgaris]